MSVRIEELVEELHRLKPGSPVLHHFRDVVDGIEWWNSISHAERSQWLLEARSPANPNPCVADAWRAYKQRLAFGRLATNVVALLKQ